MARPRCGNDPRAQLTDGDRQAIADFRAYLERRHQEKTMPEQDYEARYEPTEQEQAATAKAEAALAPLEAKARELREQQRAKYRAAVLREAADIAESLRQFERCTGSRRAAQTSENVGILRVVDELRRRADEAQP